MTCQGKFHGIKFLTACLVFILIFIVPEIVNAVDIYVDQSSGNDANSGLDWLNAKKTINAGLSLSASMAGPDTVHVAEGTYAGGITLVPETILLGGYLSGGGTRNPSVYKTIINEGAPVVTGVDNATIDGFRITGGTGIVDSAIPPNTYAGGILCNSTSPIISNNHISNNNITGVTAVPIGGACWGAGIYCIDSAAVIINNQITENSCTGGQGDFVGGTGYGSGIVCRNSTCTISGNLIQGNKQIGGRSGSSSYDEGGPAFGGGIYCEYSTSTISGNFIMQNTAEKGPGYGSGKEVWGGGIALCNGTNSIISANVIMYNQAKGAFFANLTFGGGIYSDDRGTRIVNNTISSNYANPSIETSGGGINNRGSGAQIINNTIYSNTAGHGAGISTAPDAYILNNILLGNDAYAIFTSKSSDLTAVENNDFYDNYPGVLETPADKYPDVASMETAIAACVHNISCSPDIMPYSKYWLSPTSCCIDAGTSFLAPADDIDGDPRPYGAGYDIGADEFISSYVPAINNLNSLFVLILLLSVLIVISSH